MTATMQIGNSEIQIMEYNNQRVVTFKEIDTVHGRPEGTARRNYHNNRIHFIEGVDYFIIDQPCEIRTLGINRPQGGTPQSVMLITETGYLMLVKSFRDELSWDVQRQLVNTYFKKRDTAPQSDKLVIKSVQPTKLLGGSTAVRVRAEQYNKMIDLADVSGKSLTDITSDLLEFALDRVVIE